MAQFEGVGRHSAGHQANAIAPSDATPTTFFSASSSGECKLWDLRLKVKDLVTIQLDASCVGQEDLDVTECFLHQRQAWVAVGAAVGSIDLRQMGVMANYIHPAEVTSSSWSLRTSEDGGMETVFIGDEDGTVTPLNLTSMTVPSDLRFGRDGVSMLWSAGSGSPPPPISNVCCGVGVLKAPNCDAILSSVLMDGHVVTYRGSSDHPRQLQVLQVMNTMAEDAVKATGSRSATKKHTFCNPPFPTCASYGRDGCVVVGRADGTYALYDFEDGSVMLSSAFEAPGHESNGLVALLWRGNDDLLTVAVSGEVSGWRLGPLLTPGTGDGEDVEEGALPPLNFAASLRTAERRKCVVNCASLTKDSRRLLVGDSDGVVSVADLGE